MYTFHPPRPFREDESMKKSKMSSKEEEDENKDAEEEKIMEDDKKTYKYMTMFGVIIGVVVVAQLILANYLQSIY